ncbi:60S ribosomal protein L31 [Sciurus carolinensis]|uniref:60S ribosomal protein L31 n=1 Tax=Sciurus carolinensis TaxID=30640 RepID=A0AA41T7E3_SCICA|nr:60S ribosomal protein L31 [Sciurus carolinensis]
MALKRKGGEKGYSPLNEVVTRECTINIHKCDHGEGLKKHSPWALKKTWKFATEEMRAPDVPLT